MGKKALAGGLCRLEKHQGSFFIDISRHNDFNGARTRGSKSTSDLVSSQPRLFRAYMVFEI